MRDPQPGRHGENRPYLLWRLDRPWRSLATAPLGGGWGERAWVLNAQVGLDYDRLDPDAHLAEIAAEAGVAGPGVGMMTAADLTPGTAEDGGVRAWATVGVSAPTWAADADDAMTAWVPGTINVVVAVPAALADAALVNLVATATEAKCQALAEARVPGTGTASDAVCVLCRPEGPAAPFGGPRSTWGARVARAVHAAVGERLL
ncbi:MAG TPA: adenosylcobinamide amidohydrolase [Acidimicrobiales bacterium]|nr:adenosylcobinamide amidohydrolase [Acidimicrobiales bacterium]